MLTSPRSMSRWIDGAKDAEMITLRFVSHPGPFNLLVKFAQYGFWCSHVEAELPDGRLLGSRFVGGVQARAHDYDGGDFIKEQYVTINTTQFEQDAFYSFLDSQIDKPFDSLAILSFAFSRDWQAPDSWFCAELIAAGLCASGLFPDELAVGFSHITPRDVLLLISSLKGCGDGRQ